MSKPLTLKKNYQFSRVYKKGKFYVGKYLILYVLKNNIKENQIGISASRKFGNSVKRSRISRLIKENYRMVQEKLLVGYDLVFVARPTDNMPDFYQVGKEMRFLLRKLEVYNNEDHS